jgi:hypothetical protein
MNDIDPVQRHDRGLRGRLVFLSASFPQDDRDPLFFGTARADHLSQAIVAAAHAVLRYGGRLVFGGHPTVSPLVLMVSENHRGRFANDSESNVIVYQSDAFRHHIPEATRFLFENRLGRLIEVPCAGDEQPFRPDEYPDPRKRPRSLERMRAEMFGEDIFAAIFIGGMEGIGAEQEAVAPKCGLQRCYFVGAPGGHARILAQKHLDTPLTVGLHRPRLSRVDLLKSETYSSLMQRLALDLCDSL